MLNKIIQADNLDVLREMEAESVDLIYIDPPFNTGKLQLRKRIKTTRTEAGDRIGFQGQRYLTEVVGVHTFADKFDDFLGFLYPRMIESKRVLKPTGSLYFHMGYREVHYCKLMLDTIFGRKNFLNEIIWAYDYGARTKKRWPSKHDNILVYVKDINNYYWDYTSMDRIPYMAPGLVGAEKAARGKTVTDTFFITIVPTNSKEKTGFCTQKPLKLLSRIIKVAAPLGGLVLDFFAGSGTTGEAALNLGRSFILVDSDPAAISIMQERFKKHAKQIQYTIK
jgi:site-specific DNA-methyltransferase (adenine-specific)